MEYYSVEIFGWYAIILIEFSFLMAFCSPVEGGFRSHLLRGDTAHNGQPVELD